MVDSRRKEDLSINYLGILCSRIGVALEIHRHDDDGVDIELKKRVDIDGKLFNSSVRFQLKTTSSSSQFSESEDIVTYRLKAKNYNDICTSSLVPLYLALMILPEEESEWLHWSERELAVRGRMYFYRPDSNVFTDNLNSINVEIDKKNVISEDNILKLLEHSVKEAFEI